MNWNTDQLECLRRIYIQLLSPPGQLDKSNNPIKGSHFHTLHKNAYDRPDGDTSGPEFQNLVNLFTALDPAFATHFSKVDDQSKLFDALGAVVWTSNNRLAAPYAIPSSAPLFY